MEQVRLVLSSATPKNLQFSDTVQIGHVHGAGTQLRLWTTEQAIKKNPLKRKHDGQRSQNTLEPTRIGDKHPIIYRVPL
ncbi:hypothetical protein NC651_034960 [Populus alba x Populus x berolinensis]|nr:hypothetical protein NC651_034960 [Populus alba x Populus x berolinensis]